MENNETEECNKTAVRRLHDEVWTKGNLEVIDEIYATDYKVDKLNPWRKPGASGLKEFIADNHRMFPDIVSVVDDVIAEGDIVAARYHTIATHEGDLNGPVGLVPATGKRVTWRGMSFFRFKDGKIIETWGVNDNMDLMQQLGAVRAPDE